MSIKKLNLVKMVLGTTILLFGLSNIAAATQPADLEVLLSGQSNKTTLINNLAAAKTDEQLIKDWQAIVQALNKTYYVARNDLSGFKKLQKVIKPLESVTLDCMDQLKGKLNNNKELAAEILQLQFRVANYYSIANNFAQSKAWLDRANDFIQSNNLQDTPEAAVYHNLRGGELSRQYQAGKLKTYPTASITEFEDALAIHKKIGHTLQANTHMRHIQMCLAGVIMQDALWITQTQQQVTPEVKQLMARSSELLDELEPYLGDDGYRIAGALQIRSYISTLNGDFMKAFDQINKAKHAMPVKDAGQLSSLLNEYSNICVALAQANLEQSQDLTAGKAENMYAEKAKVNMQDISKHPYAKLAIIVMNSNKAS